MNKHFNLTLTGIKSAILHNVKHICLAVNKHRFSSRPIEGVKIHVSVSNHHDLQYAI